MRELSEGWGGALNGKALFSYVYHLAILEIFRNLLWWASPVPRFYQRPIPFCTSYILKSFLFVSLLVLISLIVWC
jgi:hypothetical protein